MGSAHVAIALAAAEFDAREIPASRSATLAAAGARSTLRGGRVDPRLGAEPALRPAQTFEVCDPLVAEHHER